jgi:hypothetical protein
MRVLLANGIWMPFSQNQHKQKTENPKQIEPLLASFRVVARCKMRPAGPNRSSATRSLKQIHGAWGATEERCRAPHPCAGVDATRATSQLVSRRRSWPIPPANCAEAAHDRRKCVIRTRDKSLLSRPVCFKHLLVLVLPIIAPKGCDFIHPLSFSPLFGYVAWQISSRSANPRLLPALAVGHDVDGQVHTYVR